MRYYTIQENDSILIADNQQALSRFYDTPIYELPEDYEQGKYIVGEVEEEIEVPDFEIVDIEVEIHDTDEEGNYIYDEDGNPVTHTETRPVQQQVGSHTETVTVKKLVPNPNWDEEQAEKERVRIANLHMTRGDVFRGLLLAKGVTRADMRGLIETMPEETPEQRMAKEYALIDFDEALEFYRGVALIDTVGEQLGITPTQMDRFFDTKDWHELLEASDEDTTD
jgi:hypothetical protein